MSGRNFRELLEARWASGKFVCVGLDSDLTKIPEAAQVSDPDHPDAFLGLDAESTIVEFNEAIVDETADLVCAYKPNAAFYEADGDAGLRALRRTIEHIHEVAPQVPVILDAKRADIGNTNNGYVEMAFDFLQADAITVHPYLGAEALQPFIDHVDKGIFVLCRTSNPGAEEFQDLQLHLAGGRFKAWDTPKLYEYVAVRVADYWNTNGNCGLVVGATYPEELRRVRELVGDMPILIPGVGAQGGDLEATVQAGKDSRGRGMIINSSRGVIFASSGPDFAEAARREVLNLQEMIDNCLRRESIHERA